MSMEEGSRNLLECHGGRTEESNCGGVGPTRKIARYIPAFGYPKSRLKKEKNARKQASGTINVPAFPGRVCMQDAPQASRGALKTLDRSDYDSLTGRHVATMIG